MVARELAAWAHVSVVRKDFFISVLLYSLGAILKMNRLLVELLFVSPRLGGLFLPFLSVPVSVKCF